MLVTPVGVLVRLRWSVPSASIAQRSALPSRGVSKTIVAPSGRPCRIRLGAGVRREPLGRPGPVGRHDVEIDHRAPGAREHDLRPVGRPGRIQVVARVVVREVDRGSAAVRVADVDVAVRVERPVLVAHVRDPRPSGEYAGSRSRHAPLEIWRSAPPGAFAHTFCAPFGVAREGDLPVRPREGGLGGRGQEQRRNGDGGERNVAHRATLPARERSPQVVNSPPPAAGCARRGASAGPTAPIARPASAPSSAAAIWNAQPAWNAASTSAGAGVPSRATRIATPSAMPSWRDIVAPRRPSRSAPAAVRRRPRC